MSPVSSGDFSVPRLPQAGGLKVSTAWAVSLCLLELGYKGVHYWFVFVFVFFFGLNTGCSENIHQNNILRTFLEFIGPILIQIILYKCHDSMKIQLNYSLSF